MERAHTARQSALLTLTEIGSAVKQTVETILDTAANALAPPVTTTPSLQAEVERCTAMTLRAAEEQARAAAEDQRRAKEVAWAKLHELSIDPEAL